ncbi:MAG TPA: hypothetical protein VGS19_25135, partial [Streptosporangiaceae bacterium]|nr:hypothetical protein [Streptosporangiaceae bacterium]
PERSVSQYVVTIQPVLGTTGLASEIHETVVHIDVQGDQVLVRELTLRAPKGAALADAETPYVDFELLLKAFVRPDSAASAAPAAAAQPGAAAHKETAPREEAAPHTPAPRRAVPANSAPGKQAAPESARRVGPGRSYRRAPDPDVLAAVYEETNSIAGVAERFGVPTHTAQGWISRLRQKNAAEVGS